MGIFTSGGFHIEEAEAYVLLIKRDHGQWEKKGERVAPARAWFSRNGMHHNPMHHNPMHHSLMFQQHRVAIPTQKPRYPLNRLYLPFVHRASATAGALSCKRWTQGKRWVPRMTISHKTTGAYCLSQLQPYAMTSPELRLA